MNKIEQTFFLALYYGFARHLPPSHTNILGRLGGLIRRCCAHHLFKRCGYKINIEHGAWFGKGQNIEIGDLSDIGINCTVPNDIYIGNDVMMGPNCFIIDNDTHAHSRTDITMMEQSKIILSGRAYIGDDVWIGRQVIILSCKKIGSHSIIGAGAVVSKDIPDFAVAVGNPARVVKDRRDDR